MTINLPKGNLVLEIGDLTQTPSDVIVNAANTFLARGGGVCGAIFAKAGTRLDEHCMNISSRAVSGIPVGEAVITPAYNLQTARYIIHAVGPNYKQHSPEEAYGLLCSAYKRSLLTAELVYAETIAFPAISTGIFGFPLEKAAEAAVIVVAEHLTSNNSKIKTVKFVLFDETTFTAFGKASELINVR